MMDKEDRLFRKKERIIKRHLPNKAFLEFIDGFFIISLLAPRSGKESVLLSVLDSDMDIKAIKRTIKIIRKRRKKDISAICAHH